MNIASASTFVFLFLFLCYALQAHQIRKKLSEHPFRRALPNGTLHTYLGLSLLIPITVSFLPEVLGLATETMLEAAAVATAGQSAPTPLPSGYATKVFVMEITNRLLAAYLVTVVTLELSLQAQLFHAGTSNPWFGLLIINLGFDIASIVVIRLFMAFPPDRLDSMALVAYGLFAVPSMMTGALVVAGTYVDLRHGAAR